MGFHKAHTPGELIERIDGDVTALSNFFSAFIIKVIGNGVLLAGILVLLWRENVWVGFGVTAFTPVALFLMLQAPGDRGAVVEAGPGHQRRPVRRPRRAVRGHRGHPCQRRQPVHDPPVHRDPADLAPPAGQGPDGVRPAVGHQHRQLRLRLGAGVLAGLAAVRERHPDARLGVPHLVLRLDDPGPDGRDPDPDGGLPEGGRRHRPGAGAVRHRGRAHLDGTPVLPAGPLSVEFDHVGFSYEDEAGDGPVLHDVSFSIEPGRVLGVLGRTGSGKTTLARLLTRLYDPQAGTVVRRRGAAARRRPRGPAPPHRDGHPGRAAVPGHDPRQPDVLRRRGSTTGASSTSSTRSG